MLNFKNTVDAMFVLARQVSTRLVDIEYQCREHTLPLSVVFDKWQFETGIVINGTS